MYTMLRWVIVVGLGVLSLGVAAESALDSFLKDLRTLKGDFEQKLYSERGDLLETSGGVMFVMRPDKFRWHYQQPFEQQIVADGARVWVYDVDLQQVTVKKMDEALGKTPALILSSGGDISRDFSVSSLGEYEGVTRVELTPKDAQAQFSVVRLGLRDGVLVYFELLDSLGQLSVISFSGMARNVALEKGLFQFSPPAGVDIIQDP